MSKIECAICFESYQETGDLMPHMLQCGHTYCKHDLETILENGSIKCPECRNDSVTKKNAKAMVPNHTLILIIKEERQFLSCLRPSIQRKCVAFTDPQPVLDDWTCRVCTLKNNNSLNRCGACNSFRTGDIKRISRRDVLEELVGMRR